MALMGLDVGSTGCKAVVFDVAGNPLARAYREYPETYPQAGWIELDPARVWQGVKEVIAEAAALVREPVRALSISAMGEAFTPIGRDGNFIYNTIVSPDSRAVAQAQALEDALGAERIFQITGMPAHASFTLPKIAWMAQVRPEIHEQVWKYLLWPDLVFFKLGLEPRLDYSLAGRTMAFDVVNKVWSEEMLEGLNTPEARRAAGVSSPGPDTGDRAAGIRPLHTDLFAAPIKPGEVVGELPAAMASELGLPTGCLVVAGGHDQPMNALGAGIIEEGLAVDGMGTVECITVAFDRPVLTEDMRRHNYCCYPHVAGDLYCSLAFNYSSGSVLRWYRDNFWYNRVGRDILDRPAAGPGSPGPRADVYDLILADLPAEPTKLFTVPYFAGSGTPYLDPLARGGIFGLTLATTEKAFVKGLLEGTCYEINLNIVSLAAAGVNVDRLRVTGGGSRSPLWLQLKADITGKEIVTLNVSESGCLAGAMLGGVATGEYASLQEATEALVKEKESFTPDAAKHAQYQELFGIYRQLWPAMRDLVRMSG